jgi:hypothetical protein
MFLLAFRHITPNERSSEVGNFPVDISPERLFAFETVLRTVNCFARKRI